MKAALLSYVLILSTIVPMGQEPIKAMSFNIRYNNPGEGPNAWPNRVDIVQRRKQTGKNIFVRRPQYGDPLIRPKKVNHG